MNLLFVFVVLNVCNVIIQTIKSIATVKCGKTAAAIVNAIAYGLYTVVLVYMNCDLDLWAKVFVVATANLIGVYVVKLLEEKSRKDKLWKVETAVDKEMIESLCEVLTDGEIPFNYFLTADGKHAIFNCFCVDQHASTMVKEILDAADAKYFVSETKNL